MKRPPAQRSGFTLLEVLFSSALIAMILAGVFSAMTFMQRSLDNSRKSSGTLAVQSLALDYLARDIRSCQGANIDQNGSRLRLLLPREYEERKTFSTPQTITDDGVTYPGGNVTVTYLQSNGTLKRSNSLGKTETLIPLNSGTEVAFLPKTMTTAGSPVTPITVTLTTRPAAGAGVTKASLATSKTSLVISPSVAVKIFTP